MPPSAPLIHTFNRTDFQQFPPCRDCDRFGNFFPGKSIDVPSDGIGERIGCFLLGMVIGAILFYLLLRLLRKFLSIMYYTTAQEDLNGPFPWEEVFGQRLCDFYEIYIYEVYFSDANQVPNPNPPTRR